MRNEINSVDAEIDFETWEAWVDGDRENSALFTVNHYQEDVLAKGAFALNVSVSENLNVERLSARVFS